MEDLKVPKIELIEVTETDASTDNQALKYFCIGWPSFYAILGQIVEQIKSPIWKWAAKLGLSIINQIHSQVCPV